MIQSNGQNERCEDEDAVHELKKEKKYRFLQLVHGVTNNREKIIIFSKLYLMENWVLIDYVDN